MATEGIETYEASHSVQEACTPGTEMNYLCAETSLGLLMLAATDRGLRFVEFGASDEDLLTSLRHMFPAAILKNVAECNEHRLHLWADALLQYLSGNAALPVLPLHLHTTPFRRQVWDALRTIPQGQTRTYTQVASSIGKAHAVRAVASACAANRIALLIPCHRVLRQDGTLSGYRWGVARKRELLSMEQGSQGLA